MPSLPTTPLSVVVVARDEERFIGRCLRSAAWADDLVVIDSGSSDATADIAREHGARVYVNDWRGGARQRNFGLDQAAHDWVLCIDADEIVTPALALSIQTALAGEVEPRDGYYMHRSIDLLGELLPSDARPVRQVGAVRLFNRRYNRYPAAADGHAEIHPVGRARPLRGDLIHWRGATLRERFDAFNQYAAVDARVWGDAGVESTPLKLVFKPVLRFLWCYVWKRGFRHGMPGLLHALSRATWELLWLAQLWERDHMLDGPVMDPPASVYVDPPRLVATLPAPEEVGRGAAERAA